MNSSLCLKKQDILVALQGSSRIAARHGEARRCKVLAALVSCTLVQHGSPHDVPVSCDEHIGRSRHFRGLQADGASLGTILNAGEWRSPAFLKYLGGAGA